MYKLAIGVLAATIAVAACGGSSKSKAGGSASTTTTSGGSTTTSSPAASVGSDEFSQLVAKSSKANIKIAYKYSGTTLTIAQNGSGKSAYIVAGALTISDGAKTISCSGTTSSATCVDVSSGTAGSAAGGATAVITSLLTGLARLKPSDYGGHSSSETIAGRDATCITFKATDLAPIAAAAGGAVGAGASATSCVDKETGFALRYTVTVGGKATDVILATEFGASSPNDFNPPSTPQTVPGINIGSAVTTIPAG